MLLSVIVPFYCPAPSDGGADARLQLLLRCINSLTKGLCRVDYELLVVHDSEDAAAHKQLIELLLPYNKVVRLLRQPHRGAGAARNKGIDEARGRWLWPVDADDHVAAGSIETLLNLLQRVPDAATLVKLGAMTEQEQRIEPSALAGERLHPLALLRPRSSGLDHTTYLYRRDFLQTHALRYPETMALNEDSLFVLQCLQWATTACAYPHLRLYVHTRQHSSATAGRWSEAQSRLFIDDCTRFFAEFKASCEAGCRESSPDVTAETRQSITQQMRDTYDRYLYVYCRVLAVKCCPWPMIADFRHRACVQDTFYFLPNRADFKARCLALPAINRLLNLLCRLVRP